MNDEKRHEEQHVFPWTEPSRDWVGTITEEDSAAFSALAEKVRRQQEVVLEGELEVK
jgi:hypothetical protein